jgi:nucleotide-binding universal stress UspA family protein
MDIQIKKILCPTDFSENAEFALKYALAIAAMTKAAVELLRVVEPIAYPQAYEPFDTQFNAAELAMEIEAAMKKELDERVASLKQEHPNASGRLATGNPFLEIIQAAQDMDADLIVMGTHGRTGLAHVFMGSVAEKVVRKSPCPVLTVKHPEHKFVMPGTDEG